MKNSHYQQIKSIISYITAILASPFISVYTFADGGGQHNENNYISSYIIGGKPTNAKKSWLVSINIYDEHFCAGTLINDRWVMTAAHCLEAGLEGDVFSVKLNIDTLNSNSPETITRGVSDIFLPSISESPKQNTYYRINDPTQKKIADYFEAILSTYYGLVLNDLPAFSNDALDTYGDTLSDNIDHLAKFDYSQDIMLIKLDKPVTDLSPIHLADDNIMQKLTAHNLSKATILGWGIESLDSHVLSNTLQEAYVPIIFNSTCRDTHDMVKDEEICAGYPEGGTDACLGDSGGPLIVKYNDEDIQVGITSWGEGCGTPGTYGVYVRVSSYKEWIDYIISQPELNK